ncbi:MAG TPA: sigma-70 family RNA polymerase sigma factor [Candidatus Tumulicola sp.]
MGRWASPEIVARAVSGSGSAVEELIAAVWPGCFRLAVMVTGDRGLAEDAAQETCVIVDRTVRSLRCVEAFDGWLYRIVMRESARVRRRRGQVAEPTEEVTVVDDTLSFDIWRSLAALSSELREVTVLFYFEGLSGEEIAAALRISHGSVRVRLSRARERLRSLLSDYDITPHKTTWEVQQNAI